METPKDYEELILKFGKSIESFFIRAKVKDPSSETYEFIIFCILEQILEKHSEHCALTKKSIVFKAYLLWFLKSYFWWSRINYGRVRNMPGLSK